MHFKTLSFALLLLTTPFLIAQNVQPLSRSGKETCSLQSDKFDSLLSLPFMKFDQDMSGGWRAIADKGCLLTAAMMIDAYLVDSPPELTEIQREDLYFHAGQLYAMTGSRKLAVHRMLRSLNSHEDANPNLAWNPYVLATVAFLEGDHEGLARQRQLIATATPTPENKINIGVIDGLTACFDKPYKDAYAGCRPSAK